MMVDSKFFTPKRIAIFGIVVVAILVIIGYANSSAEFHNLSETRNLLGTYATITVVSSDKTKAESALAMAFEEIERLERILSTYENSTSMYDLNQKGFLNNAEKEILFVFEKSKYYSDLSDGHFDITIKPVLEIYNESFENYGRVPTETEIQSTLELVNYKNIEISDETISFKKYGMGVTVDGIAKGYIIDKAVNVLKNNGIDNALVDIGGDIRAIGKSDRNTDWTVALQNPRDAADFISIINLRDMAVATSGDYEQFFIDDKSVHHIINPKTGHSTTESISVTMIAQHALDADALSTAVFVLGPQNGMSLINSLEKVEGLIITENKTVLKSDHFSDFESNDFSK